MSRKMIIGMLFLVCICSNAQASQRNYRASMDASQWRVTDSSEILCRMEHRIPRFGSVVFTQEAGRPLRLELVTRRSFDKGTNVELRSETTGWNTRRTRSVLARFETSGRRQLFKIPSAVAQRTYYELTQGFQPGFLFYEDSPLLAAISNVRFGEAEIVFSECVAGLYQHNFRDVRVSSIYFEPDNEFASIKQEQSAFTRMFDYLQIDSEISEIVVTGHTDKTGLACYNDGLSERRAWYVYDLLIASGIDSQLLRVDYFGEQNPVTPGNSGKSLAANRRVTVELRR